MAIEDVASINAPKQNYTELIKNRMTGARTQRIVGKRLLCHVRGPIAHLSRVQSISPVRIWLRCSKAGELSVPAEPPHFQNYLSNLGTNCRHGLPGL